MSSFVLDRKYGIQMPNNYVDIDEQEMEYVDGGFYLSNSDIYGLLGSAVTTGGVAYIAASMGAVKLALTAMCPPLGIALFVIGGWVLQDLPGAMWDAVLQGKGVDIGIATTSWGIPYKVSFSVR